jgi:hypothetical protein
MLEFFLLVTYILPAPFWLLMIFAPKHWLTRRLTNNFAIFILLGAIYVFVGVSGVVAAVGRGSFDLGAFASTNGLAQLLTIPVVALVAWTHMVTMDLAGGYLIFRESQTHNMSRAVTSVCLFLTWLLGPLGMFVFAMWHLLTTVRKSAQASAASANASSAVKQYEQPA